MLDSQINELVQSLAVPSAIVIEAAKLLEHFKSNRPESATAEKDEDVLWFSCCLYIASVEER